MGDFLGGLDTAKSVHTKDINCLATETLGAYRMIIQFKVELHLAVDDKEFRCMPILRVALTPSHDGLG